MMYSFEVVLDTSVEQAERLDILKLTFTEVCNAIAPIAQENRCWNRVALHHLVYRQMRDQYPQLGSQMVCNAVYSVCRIAKIVYQNPKSPFYIGKSSENKIPLIKFEESCPVYFDRHTLSMTKSGVSMYTLDGRIKFEMSMDEEKNKLFRQTKLLEIILIKNNCDKYALRFVFDDVTKDEDMNVGNIVNISGIKKSDEYSNPIDTNMLPEFVNIGR